MGWTGGKIRVRWTPTATASVMRRARARRSRRPKKDTNFNASFQLAIISSDELGGDLAVRKESGAGGNAQSGGPGGRRGSRVSLGGGVRRLVRLCQSRCGDRQEQEGKRLPAHPLIELELG